MTKTILASFLAASLGVFIAGSKPDIAETRCLPTGDYMKIVRAQYVDTTPVGTGMKFNTTCFMTNVSTQPIMLKEVYVVGPGGATAVLATYNGLFGVMLQPGGQARLPINSATIAGISPETALNGNGVKSVVVAWWGGEGAVDLTAAIEQVDSGNTYSRATVSVTGVPVIL